MTRYTRLSNRKRVSRCCFLAGISSERIGSARCIILTRREDFDVFHGPYQKLCYSPLLAVSTQEACSRRERGKMAQWGKTEQAKTMFSKNFWMPNFTPSIH